MTRCPRCQTELSPHALACPACRSLVHADTLKELATSADDAVREGDLAAARSHWVAAIELLPPTSRQHAAISDRIADLTRRLETGPADGAASNAPGGRSRAWWRAGGGLVAIALLLATKLKFLLLGLTKLSTLTSMFAFFGVYWSLYGWPLALGLVLSIYVHEMGHVAMLRRLGIDAGAPLFVPGVGAFVMLRRDVTDPESDAKIGLAGPVWGLGAALAALAMYGLTGADTWFAIAQLTALLNLFNLIPIWQLDGSRGVHVLSTVQRWVLVAAWRAFQSDAGPGHTRIC